MQPTPPDPIGPSAAHPALLTQILTTDLAGMTAGRSVPADALDDWRTHGVGWVPAGLVLTPFGEIAPPNVFGCGGDLRLRPDPATETRAPGAGGRPDLHVLLGDLVELDGTPFACCTRAVLREAVAALAAHGLHMRAAFEHEFVLLDPPWRPAPPFTLAAHRRAEPFLTALYACLRDAGLAPEMVLPEFGAGQFEVPCGPTDPLAAADRAVLLRELTRDLADAMGLHASFSPQPLPGAVGSGAHVHFSLADPDGRKLCHDPARPGGLSALAGSFAAGILRHARALCALAAPGPVSYLRLVPQHWSTAYACLGERNREAMLRICPLPSGLADPASRFNLEYRVGDATANPYLLLAALIRAGVAGIAERLPAPPLVDGDPHLLDPAARFRLGVTRLPVSLTEALAALADDATLRGWFAPPLLDVFASIKRREIEQARENTPAELCRRYAAIY